MVLLGIKENKKREAGTVDVRQMSNGIMKVMVTYMLQCSSLSRQTTIYHKCDVPFGSRYMKLKACSSLPSVGMQCEG
jgi:hypothetical protein